MASAKQDNSPARLTTNSDYFPAFRDVPGDHIYDSRYYTDGEISHYKKNWCLIGEITEASTLMRPRLVVRDRNGASFVVALYLDKDVDASRILSKFKTGYTVALMYALGHLFLDGTTGVRIEDEDEITIFPCKLDEFVKLNDDADRHNWFNGKEPTCHGCGKEQKKMNVCSGCRLVCYCSKECQTEGWKTKGHNKQCKVMRDPDVKFMFQLDWTTHGSGFGFGPNAWKGRELTPREEEALNAYK